MTESVPVTEFIVRCEEQEFLGERHYHRCEPIVRCRDCKEYRKSDCTCHSWQWHYWECALEVDPDGFCAWGERKVEDDKRKD